MPAVALNDIVGRQLVIIGQIPQLNLAATGLTPLFSTPVWAQKTYFYAGFFVNATVATTATCSIGSGTTATDQINSASRAFPGQTGTSLLAINYIGPGTTINFSITVAGTGNCDIVAV